MVRTLLHVPACAKVNPVLEVLGKREDGYHELSLLFQTISLRDDLYLERGGEGIQLEVSGPVQGLAADDPNLVMRAARLFFAENPSLEARVRLRLIKKIPLAAGMGGGSSDAAAALRGLNDLFGTGLPPGRLEAMGAQLGSDVPFFVRGGTAWGRGRGERITPLAPLPRMDLVLVKPDQGLSTPEVFRSGKARMTGGEATRQFLGAAKDGIPYLAGSLFNGLEPAAFSLMPEVERIKEALRKAGARGALVSGSGPTVFGIAGSPEEARRIGKELEGPGREVLVVRTLSADESLGRGMD